MESLPSLLHDPISFLVEVLLGILAYFARAKIMSVDKRVSDIDTKVDLLSRDHSALEIKMLQFQLHAKETYVDKVEYMDAQNRVYNKLDSVADDIKSILKTKADKGN